MTEEQLKSVLQEQIPESTEPEHVVASTVESDAEPVTDRQERIEGFDQSILEDARVLLVGAGGIGGEIGEGLVKKGVGTLVICDEDVVDATNLNRQKFTEADIGENKAITLVRNLAPHGTTGTELIAHPRHFQDAVATGVKFDPDLVICAPDNDTARVAVSEHFIGEVPVVITGLDTEANGGYVFVQDTADPCFHCYRPGAGSAGDCPAAPAIVDPTKVVAGVTLYACDSVLMDRHRAWDAYEFYLSGVLPTRAVTLDEAERCPRCG